MIPVLSKYAEGVEALLLMRKWSIYRQKLDKMKVFFPDGDRDGYTATVIDIIQDSSLWCSQDNVVHKVR